MSVIAQKKSQLKKGPEMILLFMGLTFIVLDLALYIIFLMTGEDMSTTIMIPILFFLMLAGTFLGLGSNLKENKNDLKLLDNWKNSIIALGIIVAFVICTYMW